MQLPSAEGSESPKAQAPPGSPKYTTIKIEHCDRETLRTELKSICKGEGPDWFTVTKVGQLEDQYRLKTCVKIEDKLKDALAAKCSKPPKGKKDEAETETVAKNQA